MIFLPPRHGKSELATRQFPAWCLGKDPDEKVICCSYNDDTAKDFNRDVQQIMMLPAYHKVFPESRLNERNVVTVADHTVLRNAKVFQIVNHKGEYRGAGVGGTITGKGATIGIIDDPIKNHEEAFSPTYRERVWKWYTSTFRTRGEGAFAKGGDVRIVLCMTRWHEDDLAGRLLKRAKEGGEPWHVVSMPAVADVKQCEDDEREENEPLWPEKYSLQHLEDIHLDVGTLDWESLYQQRPYTPGGNIVKKKWWRFYTETPPLSQIIQSWDMSFKETSSSSYVVGIVMGIAWPNIYILDLIRKRLDFVPTLNAVRAMTAAWPMAMTKLVEDKANGPAVINVLRDEIPGFVAVTPQGSKQARLVACTPVIEAGNVLLPQDAQWVDAFMEELAAFPNGAHDDQVDALSQGLNHIKGSPIAKLEQLTRM